ncbi:MAG: hypothetical protein ABI343_15895 [Burkholderiaceae bacterium]
MNCLAIARKHGLWLLGACLALGLVACSSIDEATTNLVSSRTSASAVFAGRVLRGEAHFTHPHQATVQLDSEEMPALACFGNLRFTGSTGGVTNFICNDGISVSIPFQSLSALRGSGRAERDGAVYALSYGLAPAMAAAYLGLPVERLSRPVATSSIAKPIPE